MHYRRRPLYGLYVADSISLVGNAVAQLAIPWYVLITTGSPALTGLAVFFNFVPAVLAAFFGGVVVDRLGFRTTSVVADLASAAAVAAIPLLEMTVGIEIWQLMALVFIGALLDAPGATARQALFPDVVELAGVRMERASGIRGAIQNGSILVGGPLGGILVAGVGATTALWLNAASFVVSAAIVAVAVPRARREPDAEPPGRFFAELAEGMRFIWSHRLIRAIVFTVLLTNFLDAPFPVVMPVLAREAYGSATDLGLMYGVLGGAGLAGALAYSALGHRLPRRLVFVCCFSVLPLMYLALATLPPFPAALAARHRRPRGRPTQSPSLHGLLRGRSDPATRTRVRRDESGRVGVDPARDPARRARRRDARCCRHAPRHRTLLPGSHELRVLQPRVPRDGPSPGGRRS
ncbi:hypothetical protein BH20ACT13_BH20ACT13_11410 [soil metagenome]